MGKETVNSISWVCRLIDRSSSSSFGACRWCSRSRECTRQVVLSCAFLNPDARPRLNGRRSASTVLSQVCLGRPRRRFQFLGLCHMRALRAREWSWDLSARATWPNSLRRLARTIPDSKGCPEIARPETEFAPVAGPSSDPTAVGTSLLSPPTRCDTETVAETMSGYPFPARQEPEITPIPFRPFHHTEQPRSFMLFKFYGQRTCFWPHFCKSCWCNFLTSTGIASEKAVDPAKFLQLPLPGW